MHRKDPSVSSSNDRKDPQDAGFHRPDNYAAQSTLQRIPAAAAPEGDRATFVFQVYQHVGAALAAFIAFEVLFFVTGVADAMKDFFFSGGGARWFLMLGGVMVIQMFSANAAADLDNPPRQYIGLFGSAFGEALIFAPFLAYVFDQSNGGATVAQAAVITGIGFAMLTGIGLFTRKDLSFLRPIIMWGFGIAVLAIIGGLLFGFALGTWFSVAMIGLAGAAILYQTQSVLRRYPIGSHVAAAIALFSSLMTMFWYVLRLMMSRD
jgi:FtsH-binding integral membrane protein